MLLTDENESTDGREKNGTVKKLEFASLRRKGVECSPPLICARSRILTFSLSHFFLYHLYLSIFDRIFTD